MPARSLDGHLSSLPLPLALFSFRQVPATRFEPARRAIDLSKELTCSRHAAATENRNASCAPLSRERERPDQAHDGRSPSLIVARARLPLIELGIQCANTSDPAFARATLCD